MIDAEAFKLMHGRDDDPITQSELSSDEYKSDKPPSNAFTLLLPPTIKGYGFHNKKWSMFTRSSGHMNANRNHRYTARGTYPGYQME